MLYNYMYSINFRKSKISPRYFVLKFIFYFSYSLNLSFNKQNVTYISISTKIITFTLYSKMKEIVGKSKNIL